MGHQAKRKTTFRALTRVRQGALPQPTAIASLSSARAHSSASGKTHRCSPGAGCAGIRAAEGMGHHPASPMQQTPPPPSWTTSWLSHTLQVVAITIHSSL